MKLPFGRGAYDRTAAAEPEIRLENRYFETNPTDSDGVALLARTGTSLVTSLGTAPYRRAFTKPGLFNGDLFVVMAKELYRYNDSASALITGTVQGTGAPTFAWMKGIGYEYLFIADGLLLQVYAGGSAATGELTSNTYDYAWDSRTPSANNPWRALAWSEDLVQFAAVGNAGGTTDRVMTSPDGVTWTSHAAVANGWWGVCWSPALTLYVACGDASSSAGIMTSPDGSSWTARTTPTAGVYRSVCWAPEISTFVAIGDAGTVITSPDGVTWTAQTAAGGTNNWDAVCWSGDLTLFVATSTTGDNNRVMTSPDGINWTSQTSAYNSEWSGVCWASPHDGVAGQFVAVADADVMTSPDGIVWTRVMLPISGAFCIVWSPELRLFYIAGDSSLASSPDGVTWTPRTEASANYWRGLAWAPSILTFCAVASTGTGNGAMTSDAKATPVIVGQVIEIGGTYYSWDTDVDNGAPDGTAANPWLALLGADDIASLQSMANLLNYAGTPGVDFSTDLPGSSLIVTASAVAFSMTVTSIATDASSNAITTTVYLGTDISWGAATLTGGNVHVLETVDVPDNNKALKLISLSGYVLVSIVDSQKFYWIAPGEKTIDPLNFAEKESAPDNITDMEVVGDRAIIAGSGSTEAWYSTGDLNAPFAPMQGAVYTRGMISGTLVSTGSQSAIFVGDDLRVYKYDGGGLTRISTAGIEERIRMWIRAQEGLTP